MSVNASFLTPFWLSTIMHEESLFFVERGDGPPSAGLLFDAWDVISLTSATRDARYEQARDYLVRENIGRLECVAGSKIPVTGLAELQPPEASGVVVADDDFFHRRQIVITYRHRSAWTGPVPLFAAEALPRTVGRLRAAAPLQVCVAGDSISEGYNASGFVQAPPFQPAYPALVAQGLELAYGSPIDLQNFAAAGWSTDHGLADIASLVAARPQLVIIAFGMNDAGYAEVDRFSSNIAEMTATIRGRWSGAEFILVSSMLPNPDWNYPALTRFASYRDALAGRCGDGIALADVTAIWAALHSRKTHYDLTGNGVNHPNDFGHRIYAQAILSVLAEPQRLTAFEQR